MKEREENELVFGQREGLDTPREEVTMKDFESEPAPKTRRERFNDKFIKREGGGLARRGTATAQRAEIKERNRQRAKDAATKRRQAKNK